MMLVVVVLQLLLVVRDVDGLVLDEGRLGGEDFHASSGLDGRLDELLEKHRAVVHVPDVVDWTTGAIGLRRFDRYKHQSSIRAGAAAWRARGVRRCRASLRSIPMHKKKKNERSSQHCDSVTCTLFAGSRRLPLCAHKGFAATAVVSSFARSAVHGQAPADTRLNSPKVLVYPRQTFFSLVRRCENTGALHRNCGAER